ncbi:molybdopterin-dependent oxidoreductase [Arcobacter sp. CECT 8985]|uniref:molybdopterin-dependent oxidoreductase n=1 Tax=Arcobacter sp. CECT 8985 TaxID=1935424 RepID=UPI00100B3A5B|nr:molybdopterin-dependent oxidoreductase [Arcobacter sp. CECT 8985]RXJ87941.1 molybdopterin oxidoreductase [Arcobacter sp. CECT 8985]
MSSNKTVACPLDCYDACEAVVVNGKIRGSKQHFPTNGNLCANFISCTKEEYLNTAYFNNEKISLDSALDILVSKLENNKSNESLFYKGSGNIGVMQKSLKSFFAKYGSILTEGSLCDGGGSVGIERNRKQTVNPPIEQLLKADVIIVWGRNFSVTSSHMYELVKDKTFITIDPVKTHIAKNSDLHLALNPKTDYELALLLTRFAHMQDMEDEEFCEKFNTSEDFFDLAKSRPVISYEEATGVSLEDINRFFEIIENKKVAMVLGLGVQKYYEGANITRCIDSFAAFLGLHNNKKHCGVWYLSNSHYGYEQQFITKSEHKKEKVTEVDFSKYKLVFIQGGNPVVSAPNTKRVIDGLKNTFVVFMGTTYNDTCEYADLIIPSCSFLQKQDVRLSYGHQYKAVSQKIQEVNENSISEYDLTKYLFDKFNFDGLKDENEIIDYYKNKEVKPFEFDNFEFIDELDIEHLYEQKLDNEFYFITAKKKKSLNSSFKIDNSLYLNPKCGFDNGQEVILKSKYGKAKFLVKLTDDVKDNCVLCYAGNKNANYITPYYSDESSSSAMYQEVLVSIELP